MSRFNPQVILPWPIAALLLLLLMLPVYAPLMPSIDGALRPVTGKIEWLEVTPVPGGVTARMSYFKYHDCELLGTSMDIIETGEVVTFEPVEGTSPRLVTKGVGPQISRAFFAATDDLNKARVRWLHRCHEHWITVTVAWP